MTRSLVRWSPNGDILRRRMSHIIDNAFNEFLAPGEFEANSAAEGWMPVVDIAETDDAFLFSAEIPGLTKEDVELTLEDRTLTLRGERKLEHATEGTHYHRIERTHGSFARAFKLPRNVDTASASAAFENGVLTVQIPKSEETKPKRLEIS